MVSIFTIAANGITATLDLDVGIVASFTVERGGRIVAPLHRAPWVDEPDQMAEVTGAAPHLGRLAGDFFCAPFGKADVEEAPTHGWPANSAWLPVGSESLGDGVRATFRLVRPVMGATLYKELTVRDGHPFLYQRHVFEGGAGSVSVAHHPMVRLPHGGRLSYSPKRWAETPDTPLEPDPARGQAALAYPAHTTDLRHFPSADGGSVDLTTFPVAQNHEDFAMLVEAEGADLGWTAVLRPSEGDLSLVLKNPADLPVTMLWFSNGGRFFAPWSGRHRDVIGIEDARAFSAYGHAASAAPNRLNEEGIATALQLEPAGRAEVRHVLGVLPVPPGFAAVDVIDARADTLEIADTAGGKLSLPYDAGFLAGPR